MAETLYYKPTPKSVSVSGDWVPRKWFQSNEIQINVTDIYCGLSAKAKGRSTWEAQTAAFALLVQACAHVRKPVAVKRRSVVRPYQPVWVVLIPGSHGYPVPFEVLKAEEALRAATARALVDRNRGPLLIGDWGCSGNPQVPAELVLVKADKVQVNGCDLDTDIPAVWRR